MCQRRGRAGLNDGVDVVVIDEVLADLAFRAASIEDPGKLDDRGSAIDSEPRQDVHSEGEIGLRLRCQDTGGGEAWVVDE